MLKPKKLTGCPISLKLTQRCLCYLADTGICVAPNRTKQMVANVY